MAGSAVIGALPEDVLAAATALRRDLHRHPELSHREHRTQERIAASLEALGLGVVRVADTGLYCDIGAEGPLICVRVDTDALPIVESTGLPFSSTIDGVMHACGHDLHTAAGFATAAILLRNPPRGRVRVLFQPAEEKGAGAAACLRDGALDGVQAIIGGHVDLDYPVGTVALQPGPICAGTEQFAITITGRTSHAARPHQGTDALLCGAAVVLEIQQIVARIVEPGKPAVATVGVFHAGEAANILAGKAVLQGTLRASDEHVRIALHDGIERIARGIAAAHGCAVEVQMKRGHDPIVNDPGLVRAVRTAVEAVPLEVVGLARPNMGGEDFSDYLKDRPGIYFRIGARGPTSGDSPAHSPGFNPDERALQAGAAAFVASARALLAAR